MPDLKRSDIEPLSIPDLRQRAEEALAEGRLQDAQLVAVHLSQFKAIRPWDKVVLGRIALAAQDYKQAIHWLSQAHEGLPEEGSILVDLASAWAARKKWSTAAETMAQAIALRPTVADLHERHAIYLSNTGKQEEASLALERALALNGTHPGAWALTGERQLAIGDLVAARQSFLKSLESDPKNRSALSNLALVCEREGDLDAALDTLNTLCAHYENDASFIHRRGQILLSLGRLRDGWRDYAFRLKSKTYKSWQHALGVPYWQGEDLAGQHIVVWIDQGLGEQILTASLLTEVIGRAKNVTVACDPRLIPLFQRSFPDVNVVSLEATREKGKDIGAVDVQATLSELGAVLRPDLDSFSQPKPFLKSDEEQTAHFRKELAGDSNATLVGISWRSENPLAGSEKSTSLSEDWQQVLRTPGVQFVSLQYGDVVSDVASARAIGCDITVPDIDATRDVDTFAAITAAMDMVVSTSNTAVHVAGGLGVPTWVTLPSSYGRPWYWFAEGETSPWYGSLTLYRSEGAWAPVFDAIAQDLKSWSP